MTRPPLSALAPYLPPPKDLSRLTDAELAAHCKAMGWRYADGCADHVWRLLFEAAKRFGNEMSDKTTFTPTPTATVEQINAAWEVFQSEHSTALAEAQAEIARLRVALHDAINAPKGVVPQSADPFYRADLAVLMQYKVEPTNTPKMEG